MIVLFHFQESGKPKATGGRIKMKKQLRLILSLLCILALTLGCVTTAATAEEQKDARIICVEWKDSNNYDGIRPPELTVSLAGEVCTLNEANNWSGEVSVPHSTGNDWQYQAPAGYSATLSKDDSSVLTLVHQLAPLVSKSASVTWDDGDNARKTRPDSVQLILYADGEAYGEPKTVKAPAWTAQWDNLPSRAPGSDIAIEYTVRQLQKPKGYTTEESGLTVKNSLQTGSLSLNVSLAGAPEDADLSSLSLTVTGPDPSMPQTLTYSQLTGGTYDFGAVLPGAYLVRGTNADTLVEGYIMDGENSKVADAVYVEPGESATLQFKYTWKLPEAYEAEEDYDPMSNIGALTFEILGPDSRMPITVTYADFKDGKYELPDLEPGVYTVVERNAETLVRYYTLTGASVTGMTLNVGADGTATAKLYNQYEPATTPEPDAEFVDIPVTKTWNDNNNADGNRPESITVRLYADGVEVDSHVLTAAENWKFTFIEKPRYQDDHKTEIVYSVGEDAVAMYAAAVNGYNVVNDYTPEVTSVSVSKVWRDNNNEQNIRPTSIAMRLSDGQKIVKVVILNEANGWSATINNLPTVVNGQKAQYAFSEQEVLGYTLENIEQRGNAMIFTNAVWKRPENPTAGRKPKTAGSTWYVFEDYDTPLGVEIVINHVGDCFD